MSVSVVVVTYNAWEWTERALTALAEHTPEPHDVIVVDNASEDGTPERVRERFTDVELLVNDANTGFGPACTQGARAARGELVCLLNSDALVEPGWLAPLCEAVASRADVAAAVPMVLELDGRVQCAGALLGRDGTVLEYGNGLAAEDPAVGFTREVDFGPAACMVLDRAAFLGRGGFDPAFAPAYYEDADLCLRLAADGLRTVYVPEARVRHARYGSGTSDSAQALSERHRRLFAGRWSDVLAARPATLHPPTPARVLWARDAGAAGRILVLADPAPDALEDLVRTHPWARVTVAGRGEAAGTDPLELIAARRFHYDAVLAAGLDPAVTAALDRHQPQAARLAWPPPGPLTAAGLLPAR